MISRLKRPSLVNHCKQLGLPCSATKPLLLDAIVRAVESAQKQTLPYSCIAIDLGVKNFAFIELSIDHTPPSKPPTNLPLFPLADAFTLKVKSWEKLDFNFTKAYNPSNMAHAMHDFLARFSQSVHAFILERQPAINRYSNLKGNYQVVCLEAMLVGMLTYKTLISQSQSNVGFKVLSVSPLRISNLFHLSKKTATVKGQRKAAKASYEFKKQSSVDLVQSYLDTPSANMNISSTSTPLTFSCSSRLSKYYSSQLKRDDLSDALLIGSAHIQSILYAKHLYRTLNKPI